MPSPLTAAPVVLLVDDDPDAQFIFSTALENAGYEVVVAQDGAETVRLARITSPDIVLMDVMMPRMDGIGALHAIRTVAGERRLPIIAITALSSGAGQDLVTTAPFDEVILKPAFPAQVVDAVRRHAAEFEPRPSTQRK